MASSSVEDEIKGLCRICAGSIGPSGGGVPKIDLADPILNCLKIDIRQDTVILNFNTQKLIFKNGIENSDHFYLNSI